MTKRDNLEFQFPDWMQDLVFMVDITQHLINLNKMLQGPKTCPQSIKTQYHTCIQVQVFLVGMGSGNFFKVGGHKCTSKKLYKIFCDLNWQL